MCTHTYVQFFDTEIDKKRSKFALPTEKFVLSLYKYLEEKNCYMYVDASAYLQKR